MLLQITTDDSSFLGWLNVAVYLYAAYLCGNTTLYAKRIFKDPYTRSHQFIWGGLTLALLFLGINKQLDLQITFTQAFNWLIHTTEKIFFRDGNAGKIIRPLFIGGLGMMGLTTSLGFLWAMRFNRQQYWLPALGVLFITGFVVLRVSGFYDVALPLASTGFVSWMLEFFGAMLIGLAAGINLRQAQNNEHGENETLHS